MNAWLLTAALLVLGPELEVPEPQGFVTDLAGLLEPGQERRLEALMESYRAGSGHEVALLTIPALEGDSLEGFSLRVAERWGLGGAERDVGALLLVVRDDRKLRIETGYGLEGVLPDVICGRILDEIVAPRFRAGDWYGGLDAGVRAIHAAAGGDYGPLESSPRGRRRSAMGFGVLPIFGLLVLFAILRGRRHGGPGDGLASALPWILMSSGGRGGGFGGGGFSGGGFSGGGGFGGGGASGGW